MSLSFAADFQILTVYKPIVYTVTRTHGMYLYIDLILAPLCS